MNKTVTVNISGFVFYIEEDAYTVLSTYINRIKSIFRSDEGGDEIVNDVEARIAELFHEKLGKNKEVVVMSDVEGVIQIMGKPEEYIEDEPNSRGSHYQQETSSNSNEKRKIYRDPDDRLLGGVCSGLSYYFNTEPLLIRIAFILLFFLGMSGFIIYVVLWIIIPKAETTAEKLKMQGEKINVENIKKKVEDFSSANRLDEKGNHIRSFLDKTMDLLTTLFKALGTILTKVIGIFFGLIAIGLLIGLVASLVSPDSALNINDTSFSIAEIRDLVFHSDFNFYLSVLGVFLLVITPIIALIYGSIRLITGTTYRAKGLTPALIVLFFIGVFSASTGIIRTVLCYQKDGEAEQVEMITSAETDLLHIKLLADDMFHSNLKIDNHHENFWDVRKLEDGVLVNGQDIVFESIHTDSENFKVKIVRKSQGGNSLESIQFAENIEYESYYKEDTLYIAPYFTTPVQDGFRGQRVSVELYVPDNKKISMDENTSRINLRNVNASKTYRYLDGYKSEYSVEKPILKQEIDSTKMYNL